MLYAGFFDTLSEAEAHRYLHGGWIFVPETGDPIWFSLKFTPSAIMMHPATKGVSGRLI